MEDQIAQLGEGQSRLCTSSKQSTRRITESHDTTPKTIAVRFNTNSHLMVGEISYLSATLKNNHYSEAINELEKQNDRFVHTGLAMHLALVSQVTPQTSPQPENPSSEQKPYPQTTAEQEQVHIIRYTLRTQQLKINPIPASRGDLITEKWPRRTVARSSFSDVIIDLQIGGVTLTGTSLPLLGELTPERQSERCSDPIGIHLE